MTKDEFERYAQRENSDNCDDLFAPCSGDTQKQKRSGPESEDVKCAMLSFSSTHRFLNAAFVAEACTSNHVFCITGKQRPDDEAQHPERSYAAQH